MPVARRRLPFREGFLMFLGRTGLSQVDVARAIGVRPATINNFATGKQEPRYVHLQALLDLGMTIPEAFPCELGAVPLK